MPIKKRKHASRKKSIHPKRKHHGNRLLLLIGGIFASLIVIFVLLSNQSGASILGTSSNISPIPISSTPVTTFKGMINAVNPCISVTGSKTLLCHSISTNDENTFLLYPSNAQSKNALNSSIGKRLELKGLWKSEGNTRYIRVTQVASPVSPTASCRTGLKSISYREECGSNQYRGMDFVCYDGYRGSQGDRTSCKSPSTWNEIAVQSCSGRTDCRPSPTLR